MHTIVVFFLRAYMVIFKAVTAILPFKWPRTFEGAGSSLELVRYIATQGHCCVLVITDAMLVKLGLLVDVTAEMEKLGIVFHVYDGVLPDPTVAQIEAGVSMQKRIKADAILAIGGGSSIDAAKVIAARAKNDKPIVKMTGLFRVFRGIIALYAIPTTAGTGSEATIAAVVSDPDRRRKLPIIDTCLLPIAAALDGAMMTGLPAPITAATGMDALTHAVEAYISRNAMKRTDVKALEATQLIMQNLSKAYHDGGNLEARQSMARASHLAGIAFTQAGVGYVHAIAHNFGALYHTPHGLANAIALPYILEFSKVNCAGRLADLARACNIGNADASDEQLADAFIARINEMKAEFDIPTTLAALKAQDIPQIASAALQEARFTYHVPRYMDRAICEGLVAKMLPA